MPRLVLMEEFHVTALVPDNISDGEVKTIRRVLKGAALRRDLRQTVEEVFRRRGELARIRVKVTR